MQRLLESAPSVNLVWLDVVDSTDDWADRITAALLAAEDVALPPTVLVAGAQTAGHGRGKKLWASPVGGLYATWLGWLPTSHLANLPQAVGVAGAEAAEALVSGVAVGLKWPNDFVVAGRKLGGVLCQARGGGEQVWVRVGIGINVACSPELAPGDPARTVCLADLGWRGELEKAVWALVGGFLRSFETALAKPERTHEQWQARLVHRPGDEMMVRFEDSVVVGRFVGVSSEGHLLLEVEGHVERFAAGELVVRQLI